MKNQNQIITQIEQLLQELKLSLGTSYTGSVVIDSYKKIKPQKNKKLYGLTAEIFRLVEEGYFNERRKISDIEKKLHQRAINKPVTSLMSPLRLLIKKGIIEREKPIGPGNYEYFQPNK